MEDHWKLLLLVMVVVLSAIGEVGTTDNSCSRQQTCSSCQQQPDCAWCAAKNISSHESRCFHQPSKPLYCNNHTVNIKNNVTNITAEPLTKKNSLKHIQITPQKVSMRLRVNTPVNLTMTFRETDDLPLDLYYLMDVSYSMWDDISTLKKIGQDLTTHLRRITSKYQLGFGTFVDKVVLPILSPESNKKKLRGNRPAYGFRNNIKLTQDSTLFTESVNKVDYANAFSINDAPEGGLDALLQAVVCKEDIGWRDDARRVVLFSTDSWSHMAGIGRFAGLDLPNDGLCHLNSQREYDYSTLQDYPSVSLINSKVTENKIIVIFAVPDYMNSFYKKLSNEIVGSTVANLLSDSSNIIQLIENEYKTLRSSVEMKVKSSDPVKVTLFSDCGQGTAAQQTTRCKELQPETDVTFTVQVELMSCPSDPSLQRQTVEVSPVGLNQTLIIDVEMLCSCECEQLPEQGFEKNSSVCSHAGSYQCGVCVCDTDHAGQACECDSRRYGKGSDNTSSCQGGCSGRGHCVCGQCVCDHISEHEKVYGKSCECDNFSCKRHDQRLCNGRGSCDCGACRCEAGWVGGACECPTSTAPCVPPAGGDLCSGHGTCHCGKCKCGKDTKGKDYYGHFCEGCSSCSERCGELRWCVECLVYSTGPLRETCQTNCSALGQPTTAQQLIEDEASGEHLCMFEDENGCSVRFVYLVESNGELKVRALQEKKCPPSIIVVLFGIGALVLFIGIATLILWKVITMYHDRREFVKFQKEVFSAKWAKGENPLFQSAITTFANPTFFGKEEERT